MGSGTESRGTERRDETLDYVYEARSDKVRQSKRRSVKLETRKTRRGGGGRLGGREEGGVQEELWL